jgi:hypothetical protein
MSYEFNYVWKQLSEAVDMSEQTNDKLLVVKSSIDSGDTRKASWSSG